VSVVFAMGLAPKINLMMMMMMVVMMMMMTVISK